MTELKLDTYLNLCTQVYDLSKPIPPQAEYEFYRSYAASVNGPILEPMCGTGRFLLPLSGEGFDIQGFDASKHMLDALCEKAKARNLEVNVQQGFIEDIQITEKYHLIFIPSGSFNLIIDIKKAKRALNNAGKLRLNASNICITVPECASRLLSRCSMFSPACAVPL